MAERRKIGTEGKIENDLFNLKVGTMDKKNPNVVYVDGGIYITPLSDEDSYKRHITNIRKGFENLGKTISENVSLSKNYILNLEVPEDRIMTNKSSYLSFQYFFKQPTVKSFNSLKTTLADELKRRSSDIAEIISSQGFSFSKTKK